MIPDRWTYELGDDTVLVCRGDVLRELTPLGNRVTWTIERIDHGGIELSRGATRRNVEHDVVCSAFEDGTLAVGEPCSKGLETHLVG